MATIDQKKTTSIDAPLMTVNSHPDIVVQRAKISATAAEFEESVAVGRGFSNRAEESTTEEAINWSDWDKTALRGTNAKRSTAEFREWKEEHNAKQLQLKIGNDMLYQDGPWGHSLLSRASIECCEAAQPRMVPLLEDVYAALGALDAANKAAFGPTKELEAGGTQVYGSLLPTPWGILADGADEITLVGSLQSELRPVIDALRECVAERAAAAKATATPSRRKAVPSPVSGQA